MFNNLQNRFDKIIHTLKGYGKISDINIAKTLKEIRTALIEADVNLNIANNFIKKIKEKSLGTKVMSSINPNQLIIKIIHDELINLMGKKSCGIKLNKNINIILIVGLQGSGKTTFSAKIAKFLKNKNNKNPLLVSVDTYRPAAIEQLKLLGIQAHISVFNNKNNNQLNICQDALNYAILNHHDVIIIDTAGRLSVDKIMMEEIKNIHNIVQPSETLFIIDSMIGQDAVYTATTFYNTLKFDGMVLTKLDGDTKGGVALTISSIIPKPIKFISMGETLESIDIFYPERMADRILGMGDVVSLVEKAQEQFNEKQIKNIYNKITSNKFGFDDLLIHINKIKKMGSIKDLLSMIPGISKYVENISTKDDIFKITESVILSMTPYERKNPNIININRKKRISKGSGISLDKINKILKQYNKIKEMTKIIENFDQNNLIKNFFNKKKL